MQSEKLKALAQDWRQRARDQFGAEASAGYEPQLVADTLNGCADELDAEIAALASPSPAPSEPLREIAQSISLLPCLARDERNPEIYAQVPLEMMKELRAALDSTKASEPAAPARDVVRPSWRIEKYGSSLAIFEGERRVAYLYGAFEEWTEEETKAHAERMISTNPLAAKEQADGQRK